MVEHWGVYEGLRYARKLGFKWKELNVDSLVLVNAIIHNGRGSLMSSSLVAKIFRLLDLEEEVVFNHFYREAN